MRPRGAVVDMQHARGSSEPAIHFLRAVTGVDGVRNQVQGAPAPIRAIGWFDAAVGDHHMGAAGRGDLAPPRSWCACRRATVRGRAARHGLDLGGDARHDRDQRGVGMSCAGGAS